MNEKDMVNDVLSMTKQGTSAYTTAIGECSNCELRKTLQNIRNNDEKFQFDLSNIAIQKGYYVPSKAVTSSESDEVKSQVSK